MLTASPWITTIAPAAALGAAVGVYGIYQPRARIWGPVVSRVKREPGAGGPPRVALTFDDGPTPQSTPAVLNALDAVDAKATFFVIGRNVLDHPRLLAQTQAAGHLIANHTHTHPRLGLCGLRRFWRRELDACDDAVSDVIGQRPAFFRPPMGLKHWHLLKEVAWGGQTCVNWSRRAKDGNTHQTPRRLVHRLTNNLRDGEICLLHDGHEPDRPGTRQHTADAIPALVNQIRDRGFELVRLDELLGQPGYLLADDASHETPLEELDAILPSSLERR